MRTITRINVLDTILELYANNNLCRIDENNNTHKDPTIICSMGLKYE